MVCMYTVHHSQNIVQLFKQNDNTEWLENYFDGCNQSTLNSGWLQEQNEQQNTRYKSLYFRATIGSDI